MPSRLRSRVCARSGTALFMFYVVIPSLKPSNFPLVYTYSSLSAALSSLFYCLSSRHSIFCLFNSSFIPVLYRGSSTALQTLWLDFHDVTNPHFWRYFDEP